MNNLRKFGRSALIGGMTFFCIEKLPIESRNMKYLLDATFAVGLARCFNLNDENHSELNELIDNGIQTAGAIIPTFAGIYAKHLKLPSAEAALLVGFFLYYMCELLSRLNDVVGLNNAQARRALN